MRRFALLFASMTALAVAAVACSGGKGGGAKGEITSGTYTMENVEVVRDECVRLGGYVDGVQLVVAVTNGTVTLLGLEGSYADGIVAIEEHSEYEWTSYDCLEDNYYTIDGRATADDQLQTSLNIRWVEKSGTECADAYAAYSAAVGQTVELPCESEVRFRLTKTGPPPTPTPTPIPITGTLTTAWGFAAPLTIDGMAIGTDLNVAATLNGESVTGAADTWRCYAPDLPLFPNYDIDGSDGTSYRVVLSITTAAWSVGTHAIDGTNLTLAIGFVDRFGEATGGNVTLHTAPANLGTECVFSLGDVPLVGEQDPPAFAPWSGETWSPAGKPGLPQRDASRRIPLR